MSDSVGDTTTLSSFVHRRDYGEVAGRDRWTVRVVDGWVRSVLPSLVPHGDTTRAVLDVGCAEQPFRVLVESTGARYVGMDVVQNRSQTVDILSTLEDAPSGTEPYCVILCTEVLEHVVDVDAAFAGLRRLVAAGGAVILTVPFVFPIHMEPYDFRRLTLRGIEQLATDHGFRVETSSAMGRLPEVLATLIADASILPASRSFVARAKVGALRLAAAAAVRLLDSGFWSRGIVVNANCYLSNGVVLRAI